MPEQIIPDHGLESLKVAAGWPNADQATLVVLATIFAATGADADGLSYFGELAARQPFIQGFAAAARSGLQAGSGQPGARIPAGTPAALVPHVEHLIQVVFTGAYIAAMRSALALPVALLLAGAAACLLLGPGPRRGRTPPASPADHHRVPQQAVVTATVRGNEDHA